MGSSPHHFVFQHALAIAVAIPHKEISIKHDYRAPFPSVASWHEYTRGGRCVHRGILSGFLAGRKAFSLISQIDSIRPVAAL